MMLHPVAVLSESDLMNELDNSAISWPIYKALLSITILKMKWLLKLALFVPVLPALLFFSPPSKKAKMSLGHVSIS